jgi:hypothetical protein
MIRPAQEEAAAKGRATRARKARRKQMREVEQARQATGCGPVTVTNTRTGQAETWKPYTPKQLAAMNFGTVRRPRRRRA